MKNHKDNERFNDITSKNQQKDGSVKSEHGKGSMQQPGKEMNGGKGPMQQPGRGMNDGKGVKHEKEEDEEDNKDEENNEDRKDNKHEHEKHEHTEKYQHDGEKDKSLVDYKQNCEKKCSHCNAIECDCRCK